MESTKLKGTVIVTHSNGFEISINEHLGGFVLSFWQHHDEECAPAPVKSLVIPGTHYMAVKSAIQKEM